MRSTRKHELTGRTFHEWRVIGFSRVGNSNKQFWKCVCSCGAEKEVESYNLTSGRSKSCRKCSAKIVGRETVFKHGLIGTVTYKRWIAMKSRCSDEKQAGTYKYYGALGIKVADVWLNDFPAFLKHIGEPPTSRHSVDRIDPFGDYAPGNVRWATQTEQRNNLRRHVDLNRYYEQREAQTGKKPPTSKLAGNLFLKPISEPTPSDQ